MQIICPEVTSAGFNNYKPRRKKKEAIFLQELKATSYFCLCVPERGPQLLPHPPEDGVSPDAHVELHLTEI